jgi:hypothetical protein
MLEVENGFYRRRNPFVVHLFAHPHQPLSPGPFPHPGEGELYKLCILVSDYLTMVKLQGRENYPIYFGASSEMLKIAGEL